MTNDALPAQTGPELEERVDPEVVGAAFVYQDGQGREVVFEPNADQQRLAIGRSMMAEIRIDFDPLVSRLHAELERIEDDWILTDRGLSRNGSFVNEEQVTSWRRLRDGDLLRFGSTIVTFRAASAAADG
jgi:pSer/pThr/pTyr-binding forkhead associated (FHA) protein